MYFNPKYCTVTMITQRDFALNIEITCQASFETCIELHQCLVTNSNELSARALLRI